VAHGVNYMELQYSVRATAISHWTGHTSLQSWCQRATSDLDGEGAICPKESPSSRLCCRH